MECDYLKWPITRRYGIITQKFDNGKKNLQGKYSSLGILLRHQFEKLRKEKVSKQHFINICNRVKRMIYEEENLIVNGNMITDEEIDYFTKQYMAPPREWLEVFNDKKSDKKLTREEYEKMDKTFGKYKKCSQNYEEYIDQKRRQSEKNIENKIRKLGEEDEVRIFYFPSMSTLKAKQQEQEGEGEEQDQEQEEEDEEMEEGEEPQDQLTKINPDPDSMTDEETTRKLPPKPVIQRITYEQLIQSDFLSKEKYTRLHMTPEGGIKIALWRGQKQNKYATKKFYDTFLKKVEPENILKGDVVIICVNSPMDTGEMIPMESNWEYHYKIPETRSRGSGKNKTTSGEDSISVVTAQKKRKESNEPKTPTQNPVKKSNASTKKAQQN